VRAVVDTSILVRAVIRPQGTVGPVLEHLATRAYTLVDTDELLAELADVLGRQRLRERFGVSAERARLVLAAVERYGEQVTVERRITACRDSKDDKVLEAAVAGRADVIVSGDDDLLVLSPFEGIPVVGPSAFLAMLEGSMDR
jgi:putative PIN family toxin of toxin-antitoxin system